MVHWALPEALHGSGLHELAHLGEGEEGQLRKGDVAAPAGQVFGQQLHHLGRQQGGGARQRIKAEHAMTAVFGQLRCQMP